MKKHRRFAMLAQYLVVAATAIGPSQATPLEWRRVARGMEVIETNYEHRAPIGSVKVQAVRFDPRRFRVEVVDLSGPSRSKGPSMKQSSAIPSLRLLSDDPKWIAAINGAYISSYAFPRPMGLVRTRGISIMAMNGSKPFSGVVCVEKDGEVEILKTSTDPGPRCVFALESGPLIVEANGKNGIRSSERADYVYERSAICVDDDGWVILVRTDASALYDLAEFLRRDDERGGLDCEGAINMSGDADSGMFWREARELRRAGSMDAALATAVAIELR